MPNRIVPLFRPGPVILIIALLIYGRSARPAQEGSPTFRLASEVNRLREAIYAVIARSMQMDHHRLACHRFRQP
jgi:hypothetical protein